MRIPYPCIRIEEKQTLRKILKELYLQNCVALGYEGSFQDLEEYILINYSLPIYLGVKNIYEEPKIMWRNTFSSFKARCQLLSNGNAVKCIPANSVNHFLYSVKNARILKKNE